MRTTPRLLISILGLSLASLLSTVVPAEAKQCHIRISASGRFQGEVIDHGSGQYTRFAVKVEYDLSSVSLRYDYDNQTLRGCPRTPGEVDISADSSIDPLMFHFLNELAGSARVDSVSHRFQEVNATTVEFQRATRKLQLGGLGRAWVEIGITVGWDVFQAVVPLGFTTALALDFVVETVKEVVKGGGGEGLTKWMLWKIPSLVKELGLDSDEAKELAGALEKAAKGIDRELADKLKPITITRSGTAGECQIVYTATLDLKSNRYHVNFDKRCGDREPEVPTASVNPLSVDPGQAEALTARAFNYLGTPWPLKSATVTGLAAIMTDGSAEPAAVIAGGTATFNFNAAKPRKDGDYPVTVNLTTFDDKTARWSGTVTVNNVGPTVSSVDPTEIKADPGDTMSLQNATVTVIDDNADKNNRDEVKARDLELGPHPADLEMSRTNAFGDIDGTPRRQSFDPSSGTYVFTFNRNGGKVKKPQMHKTVSTTVTITDNNGLSANGAVTLKVNDVEPKVTDIKLNPQFLHRNAPPKTITLSGRISDDNGADDIDRPESYADVSKASSGGPAKLVLGNELAIKGAPGEDYIDFEGTFPQTNEVGAHNIDIFGQDKSGGGHPDGPHKGTADILLNVGNAKPVINPWGYIYDTELGGTPDPNQRGDGLCPGQPFLAGAIVKDPENDALLVWATIKETGVRANLTLVLGEKTHKGTLNAPATPGEYTLLFDAKEKDLGEVAVTTSTPLTVISCAHDDIDDMSWGSSVRPESLCPTEPFTAEGFVTYFLKDKTERKVYPTGTITFQAATQTVGATQPQASFTAPGTPGVYPVSIVINIGGTPQTMTPQVTVEACGLASADDLVDPDRSGGDLVSDGFDMLSNPELFNPISGSRDVTVQLMIIDIVGDPSQPMMLLGQARKPRRRPFFADLVHAVRQTMPMRAHRRPEPGALLYAGAGITSGATWPESRSRTAESQSRGAVAPNVSAFITSLGTSYGEAFEMKLLNNSDAPVNLVGKGIVVEPLKKKAQKELRKQLDKQVKRIGKNPVTTKLDAYCLEFVRQPPSLGTVFRIANQELQRKFQPMRYVLTASRRLQDLGALTPDTEATEYYHSIRQWAIWSKEQGFRDESAFGKAFVEKTKGNFEAAGRPWTGEIEQLVQALVPNRWRDIDSVLQDAATLAAREGGPW